MTYNGLDDEQVPPSSSTDKEPESAVASTLMELDIDVIDVEDWCLCRVQKLLKLLDILLVRIYKMFWIFWTRKSKKEMVI